MSRQSKEEALINGAVKATHQGITLVEAKALIRTWLQCIADTVSGGEEVHVAGFGTFYSKTSKERRVRAIHTGEMVLIPPKRALGFRPAGAQKWGTP